MIRYWSRWWWKKSTWLQEIIHIWDILSFSLVQSAASAIKSNASTRRTINYGAEPCCVPCQRKTDCTTAGVVQKSPLTRHWKKTRPRGQGDFPSKCCHQQSFLLLFAKKKTTNIQKLLWNSSKCAWRSLGGSTIRTTQRPEENRRIAEGMQTHGGKKRQCFNLLPTSRQLPVVSVLRASINNNICECLCATCC